MRFLWIVVIGGIASLGCMGNENKRALPSVQVTRYLSGGVEHLNLRCLIVNAGQEPKCEVIRERNGEVISTVAMTPAEVKKSLRRYFQKVPKNEVSRVGMGAPEKWEQRSNTALVWNVSSGEIATKGSVSQVRDYDTDGLLAILSLEMDLSTQGIR